MSYHTDLREVAEWAEEATTVLHSYRVEVRWADGEARCLARVIVNESSEDTAAEEAQRRIRDIWHFPVSHEVRVLRCARLELGELMHGMATGDAGCFVQKGGLE